MFIKLFQIDVTIFLLGAFNFLNITDSVGFVNLYKECEATLIVGKLFSKVFSVYGRNATSMRDYCILLAKVRIAAS